MASPRFLVLASSSDERRMRSMIAAFGDVEEARQEFSRVKQRLHGSGGWVELAAVDDDGRLDRMCRSGDHSVDAHVATNCSANSGADPMCKCT